ncbi:MAG: trimeric intracellular cation channel family protein [Clostridia bacterium]|nr:trimeric intracellular cation channel family protein [Clostridia bacterium]
MIRDFLINIMEWIGTVAFSVSGVLVAVGCSLDLFGVIIVGCITAVGGGMMRDLLLGRVPPQIFFNPAILLVAVLTAVTVFIIAYINAKKFKGLRERVEKINNLFDALGLAAFSVTGVEIACNGGYADNALIAITMGVITGVGGGILRDVLVNEKPYVLTKHIYAVASIIGSGIYYLARTFTGYDVVGTFAAVGITIMIRLLAAKYRWELPKINLKG